MPGVRGPRRRAVRSVVLEPRKPARLADQEGIIPPMPATETPILDAWRSFNQERAEAVGDPPTLRQAPIETRDEHQDAGARWLVHFCQKHDVRFSEFLEALQDASSITAPNITALAYTGALKPEEIAEAAFAAGWACGYFTAREEVAAE